VPATSLLASAENVSKILTKSTACEEQFVDRALSPSRFSVPLNVLGGGSFRWPGAPSLDRAIRDEIVGIEVA
jgi:hypothetical protein